MVINLERLWGFYWVAKTGGYTRAVEAFPYPITQPGVHQQVRRLEAELGVVLFERTGRDSMTLTAAGQLLFDDVEPFLDGLPSTVEAVRAGALGGTLRIHTSAQLERHVLAPWLSRVRQKRPDIRMHIQLLTDGDLGLLRSFQTDLLVEYLADVPSEFESIRVGTIHAYIVVSSQHRADPYQLCKQLPFIAYPEGDAKWALQLRALQYLGAHPEISVRTTTAEGIIGHVAAGLGCSLVPFPVPPESERSGIRSIKLDVPEAVFPVWAVWRRTNHPNPLLRVMIAAA